MQKHRILRPLLPVVALIVVAPDVLGQDDRLTQLERRVQKLEQDMRPDHRWNSWTIEQKVAPAIPVLLIALLCGLLARNTGRDFWLWFVVGLLFNCLALIVLWSMGDPAPKEVKLSVAKGAATDALDLE